MTPARRLRTIGMLVLACGIIGATVFYWLQMRSAQPEVDELAAGYLRAQEHQTRLMMGPMGATLSQWADALSSPLLQALLILGFAAFVAYMCFRHASFADEA
jgi:hypothetical protein